MGEIPILKSKEIVRALERAGFVYVRQKGSHIKLRRAGFTTIVPDHGNEDMPPGTLKSILKQAGLTIRELKELLD